ncbi:MAG: hypothetical protein ACO1RT_18970 [Planctomycetaceae bacterium]
MNKKFRKLVVAFSVTAIVALTIGCERKETILDIETPDGNVEVERSLDTGAVDVEVTDKP